MRCAPRSPTPRRRCRSPRSARGPAHSALQPGSGADPAGGRAPGRARVLEGLNVRIRIAGDGGAQILKPEQLLGPRARDMRRER